MSITDFGDIDFYGATLIKPRPEPTLERSKSILGWYENNVLLPYKTEKMSKDELVKKIKNEPVMVISPNSKPGLKFWITLGEQSPIILVENTATKEMQTYVIPPDKPFDLSFISVVPEDKNE